MKTSIKPKLESITYTVNLNKIKLYSIYNESVGVHEFSNASSLTKRELENNIKTIALNHNLEPISEQIFNVSFEYLNKLKRAHKNLRTYKFYIVNLDYNGQKIKLNNVLKNNSQNLNHSNIFGYPFKSFKTAQNSLDIALKRFGLYGTIETIVKIKKY